MNKHVHTILRRKNEYGLFTTLETWLPEDNRVKVGSRLTLKGFDELWTVVTQGDPMELPESAKHNSKKWHEHDDHRAHKGLTINK